MALRRTAKVGLRFLSIRDAVDTKMSSRFLFEASSGRHQESVVARRFFSTNGSTATSSGMPSTASKSNNTFLLGAGLAAAAGLWYYMTDKSAGNGSLVSETVEQVGRGSGVVTSSGKHPNQLPRFQLTDHQKNTWTDGDMLGDFAVIQFSSIGAPNFQSHLQRFGEVIGQMERKTTLSATPLLISLSPEKDTPQKLADTLASLAAKNPALGKVKALTGSDSLKIWEAAKDVTAKKSKEGAGADVPESDTEGAATWAGVVYLVDPDGSFVAGYGPGAAIAELADEIAAQSIYYKRSNPSWKGPKAVKNKMA